MISNPERQTRRSRTSIGLWLAIAAILLALVPVLVVTGLQAYSQSMQEKARIQEGLTTQAKLREQMLLDWVANTQLRMAEIAEDAQLRPAITGLFSAPSSSSQKFAFSQRALSIIETRGTFDRLLLVDVSGTALASSDPSSGTGESEFGAEPWLGAAMANPDSVVLSGPINDPADLTPSLYFSIILRASDNSPAAGVLVGRIPASALSEVLAKVPLAGATEEYYLVHEGQQYVVAAQGDPDSMLATDEIVSTVLRGETGSGQWLDYQGEEVAGAYRWVEPLQMGLVVKQDLSTINAGIWAELQVHLLVAGLTLVLAAIAAVYFARSLTRPLRTLTETASRVAQGELTLRAPESDTAEFNLLANAFNAMTGRLTTVMDQQESSIRARTRQLELTTQIGRAITAETNPERILSLAINSICDQLGYYHAQIFMLDDLHQHAILRASTGAAGQALLERNHKLAVGSQSVIGQVTSKGEPVLVLDTDTSAIHRRNELLPDTRAELAIPLQIGAEIMGALDVQSINPNAFDEATIASFRTIADQLAVAIRNGQLFSEKENLLSASLQLTQTLTRDNWDSYLEQSKQSEGTVGFKYDLSDVKPIASPDVGGNGQGDRLPIALRGQVIGEVEAELGEGQNLSDEQKTLVGQVLDRVALALENARLFEQTQLSLMEANRLYQASQAIASADTVQALVNSVLSLLQSDVLDRAAVVLLEEIDASEAGRWARIMGRWTHNAADVFLALPDRVPVSQFPLLAKFEGNMLPDGLVINDVTRADMDKAARNNLAEFGVRALADFPLITGGRTLGWLMLHATRSADVFSEADTRYYASLADQTATALEGLRLFEQAQSRVRRVQAVNEVSRAASSILNPDILLPLTVDKIGEAFDYYHTQMFLVDEFGKYAVLRASTGEVGQELLRRQHKLEIGSQSVIGQVTSRGEPVIARDTDTDAVHKRNELLPDTRAEMAIPLKTGDRVIGALDLQSTQVNAFDPEAQAILQSLADQLSVTLENAQLFQEIQDRVAELTTVNLISQAVSRAETLDDLYEVVATQLQRSFGVQYATLVVVGADDLVHVPIFLEGGVLLPPIAPFPAGEGLTSHVLKSREVLLLNENVAEEALRLGAKVVGAMSKSLLAVPLLLGEEVIGVLSIQDADKEFAYNETHVRQLTTLAAYIAIKIRNAELLEEAQSRASELGFLFNVTRAAVSASNLDDALTNVAGIVSGEIAGTDAATIYLTEPDAGVLIPHAAVGYGSDIAARYPEVPFNVGLLGIAAADAEPLVVNDIHEDSRYASFDNRTRSVVIIPLKTGTELIGNLMIASTQVSAFKEREQRLLEAASGTLTAIIQNARLLNQITAANDQLRELDKLKSQFLANMSHELRTPLNSIIGFSRVMLKGIDGSLNDLQTQDLTTIYTSGQHLLGLINDILDLSKIEAGKMEIQPEMISLVEIIDGVMATGKGLIKDKPIQIYKEIEANLPPVYGDPVRVRQVLLNLVSNASKFTAEGGITIRAIHKPSDSISGEPERVQVDVQDTGMGIAESDIARLFEAFQQVDGSTTRQVGGTGLGLAISKQFIEMHNGRMWIESEMGVGSTFSFTIPLNPPMPARTEQVISTRNGHDRPVVLAVDDEPGVLDLYSRYLDKGGYAIVGLNNANELLAYVRQHHPAALLLDLNMPGKDGWAAIDDVKKADDTRNIPIIICSIEDQRERANRAGVNAYLIKPIVEDDLIRTLDRVIHAAPVKSLDVMMIDPDPNLIEKVQTILHNAGGYSLRSANAGHEGLQAVMRPKPDLLILDIDLPDMDGYGLLTSLRSQSETAGLSVLILTGRELTADDLSRVDAAHTRHLSKTGLQDGDFLRAVEELAERARTSS